MKFVKTFEFFHYTVPDDMVKEVTKGYIETAIWTAELDDYSIDDVSKADVKNCEKDVKHFLTLMSTEGYLNHLKKLDNSNIGHNFWLTRNRHGSGFWDQVELEQDKGEEISKIINKHFVEVPDPIYDEDTKKVEFY